MNRNAGTRLSALALPLALLALAQGGGCGGGGRAASTNARASNSRPASNDSGNAKPRSTPAVNDNRGGGTGGGGAVARGEWGGRSARLSVTEDGAEVEFDCAHGRLGRLTTDAQGNFDVRGVFVAERGGPVHINEQPDERPARYTGRVEGKRMTLTVDLSDGTEQSEPLRFTLTHGASARLTKCL